MDAHRVDIFHIADGDTVAVAVPDHFVFDLLPAADIPFHQDFTYAAQTQAVAGDLPQLILIISDTAAAAAQCISRPDDHRITDLFRKINAALKGGAHITFRHRFVDLFHGFFKRQPILCPFDGQGRGSDHLHPVFLQEAGFVQFHGYI